MPAGFYGTVTLSLSGGNGILAAPGGASSPTTVSYYFGSAGAPLNPSTSVYAVGYSAGMPLTLIVGSQVPPGTYQLQINGTSPQASAPGGASLTLNVAAPLPAPTGLAATGYNGGINLSWNRVSGASFYALYRSTSPGGEGATPVITVSDSASYYDTGLTNGTTYYYQIAAVNDFGAGLLSAEASAAPHPVAPMPPTALVAGPYAGTVQLSWMGTPEPGATYSVYRGTAAGGESATPVASGLTTTFFTDSAVAPTNTYYYVVRAANAYGASSPSNEASCTVPLPAPTGLAVTRNAGPVTLAWTASPYALSYKLYRGTDPNQEATAPLLTGLTGTGVTDTSAAVGKAYYYRLTAVNGSLESPPSNEATTAPSEATYASASPYWVTGTTTNLSVLGADAGGEASLTYTWDLWESPAPVTFSANGTNAAKNVTATFTALGWYGFRVTIRNAVGLTTTDYVTCAVGSNVQTLTLTPSSAAVPGGGTQQFSAVTLDQFGSPPPTPPAVNWSVNGGGSIDQTGLFTAGATASGWYVVTATAGGLSATASVLVTPSGQTGLTAAAVSASQINLTWDASFSAAGYRVYRGTASGGPYTVVAPSVTANYFYDTGLTAGTPYFYVVTALPSGGGESAPSNEAMAVPYASASPPAVTPVYGYTDDGLRAWKTVGGQTTYFLYDGGVPVCELDGGGNVIATNTWGASGLLSRRAGSASVFYAFDPSGNVAHRLDGGGNVLGSYVFDAFGVRTGTDTTSDPYSGFGGQFGGYKDAESGLTLLSHRYYDAGQGRFLTRDPLGYAGGSNLYAYAGNNPVMLADPSGFSPTHSGDGPSDPFGPDGEGNPDGPLNGKSGFEGFTPGSPQNTASNNALNGVIATGAGLPLVFLGPVAGALGDAAGLGGASAEGAAAGDGAVAGGPLTNCFVAGTPVQMADGSSEPIEEVKADDLVVTKDQFDAAQYNEDGSLGNVSSRKVVRTFVHDHAKTLSLILESGEEITTTFGHPFFVEGVGWRFSGQLAVGNAIVTRAGPAAKIVSIKVGEEATVYNFEVQGTHTYFVGQTGSGLWVHNASKPSFYAELTGPDGNLLGSGFSGPKVPLPDWLQDLVNSGVAAGKTGNNPGGCAEINAIIDSGLTQSELEGSTMTVFRNKGPNKGLVGVPCGVCQWVLGPDGLNIIITPGGY